MRGSNSKMLQYRWNGSFQLQNAPNCRENGHNRRSKKSQNGKKNKKKQNNSRPFLHTDAFAHTCFYTEKQLTHTNLCTQYVFIHKRLLHREALFPLLDHQPFVFLFSSLTWYPFFMFLTTMFGVSWRRGACAVRHHGALQIANMKIPVWCMTRMQCLGKSWLHVFAPPDIIYIYFFFRTHTPLTLVTFVSVLHSRFKNCGNIDGNMFIRIWALRSIW